MIGLTRNCARSSYIVSWQTCPRNSLAGGKNRWLKFPQLMNSFPCIRRQQAIVLSLATVLASSQCFADSPNSVRIGPALAIGSVGHSGRSPVHTDAIEAKIISGTWHPPTAGDRVELPNGTNKQWNAINAGTNGWFDDAALRGGYVYVPVVAESDCVRILEAQGDGLVYVNGELRQGDPYQTGYVHLPVPLRAGTNDFLFQCGGRLKFELAAPSAPISFNTNDMTLPDLIAGQSMDTWGAVVIVNATGQTQTNLAIRA